MEIIVHRGTHQIGGCATEVRTKSTRILIDFGAELPDATGLPIHSERPERFCALGLQIPILALMDGDAFSF